MEIVNGQEVYTITKDAQTKYNEEIARRNTEIELQPSETDRITAVESALSALLGV